VQLPDLLNRYGDIATNLRHPELGLSQVFNVDHVVVVVSR
jgi:hypothetical protein